MGVKDSAISIKNLSFQYKTQENEKALNNLNLEIEKGQFVVIMGPSGAGKSTLANSLNGLIPNFIRGKYEGNVVVGEMPVKETGVSKMAKKIGLVFQDFEAQLFSTNAKLEIAFGPENFGIDREKIEEIIKDVLRVVDLESFGERHPATLSGGQKQRLAIGSVLASQPDIICMDEPTTDLDPLGKLQIFKIANNLHENEDFTLVIIEHETEEALHADRIVVMKDGKIIEDGKPKDILKKVDTYESLGLMPLQIPLFFKRAFKTEENELPLTVEDGIKLFKENNLKIDDDLYKQLLDKDIKRENGYGETVLKVSDLKHTYPGGVEVLKGIDLELKKGEFLAILGHNGSGKTTLVRHFNGLLAPTEGNVLVNGLNTRENSIYEIGKHIGYVFQNPDHQIFADTVYEEVAFSPKIRGCKEDEIKQRVKQALESVALTGYEEADPFMLSKGERQRVAVAAVLSAQPQIIILDEPTTGLDYAEQRQMMELIKKLNEEGHTIIIITHTMWVAAEYAHKVAAIRSGEIMKFGKTRDVFKEEEELLKSYLKTPHIVQMSNVLNKTVLSVDEMIQVTKKRG